jgi:hypothetical protein
VKRSASRRLEKLDVCGGLIVPGSNAVSGEGKDALTSAASVFRAWVADNPPENGVLLRFVTDMLRSMEICDHNFEKVLGRMKYVDEFMSEFVESIQDRLGELETLCSSYKKEREEGGDGV